MSLDDFFRNLPEFPGPEPKRRNDEREARRWRGPLFRNFRSPMPMWKDEVEGYVCLKPPSSVSFPICALCGYVIWDWPHFQEEVPDRAICTACAEEELNAPEP